MTSDNRHSTLNDKFMWFDDQYKRTTWRVTPRGKELKLAPWMQTTKEKKMVAETFAQQCKT